MICGTAELIILFTTSSLVSMSDQNLTKNCMLFEYLIEPNETKPLIYIYIQCPAKRPLVFKMAVTNIQTKIQTKFFYFLITNTMPFLLKI